MDDNTLSLLITWAAAACFAASSWAVFWIWRGRRGGWARLAGAYKSPRRRDSAPRRFQSFEMMPSGVGYPGLVTLRMTVDGLYAVPSWLVRFGHDPLLVPWDDIEIIAVDTYPADRLYDLKFVRVPQVRARVGVGVAQLIRRAADNSQYFLETSAVHTRPALPAPRDGLVPSPGMAGRGLG